MKRYQTPQCNQIELNRIDVLDASGETWTGQDGITEPGAGGGSTGGDDWLDDGFWN